MGSLLARAYKRILRSKLAQDEGEHWVTVNAGSKEGGEGGGSHVLLDGEGRVVAGMGGKFKGQNIDRIERKKFINQNAWNRQRKTLTEKAGDDTQLKRVVTAGMRSQAEKEADKSNDTWQKEGLYNALVRRTQRENKGMINVLHDHLGYKNAQPKAVNPIAEKIQKQSDGVKQIVTEAITKYNDLEAVNQLNSVPDGVNVVTEKGQFFKTGDLWSSPDGKKTLENDQMFRLLKKELKSQISNKDMDNLIGNELEKVQYKDVAEKVKDIDPNLAKEIENTENKYNKLKAENIAKAERSEHEKKRGGGHAISFEEQNTEKKLQELKAQAEAKIAEGKQEAPKAEEPKTDRKSLIDQANARHTMPMGDIIARKEQAITDKINNSNLSEEDKKKYLDKLNSLTDEALKAGAGSLDLYKVGVSYKKTNAETNAFNKMFSKQGEIDNLEKEINKKVQDNITQAENKLTSNSLKEAERTGAVYFMDPNGKEFYRANSKSKTWYQIDQYNQAKGEKAKAKQEALNAKKQQEAPKAEEQPKADAKANYKETEIIPVNHDYVASRVKAKLENSTRSNPRIDLGLALMNTLDDVPAGTFVKGKDGGPMYKKTTSGWVIPGLEYKSVTPDLRAFESKGDLTLGIGKTADEAKANTKTTELQALKKHDAEQLEKAEREKAEKAEREERSKDFYLNKIDKIKDRISNGENYSAGLYKSELYKSLTAKAKHGNVEEVNRVLNELKKEGIYTDRHRIWGLADIAKRNADYITERHEKSDKTTTTLKGATVNKEVYNGEARTSVKFDKIPNYATRVALKQNGFKWNADAGEWYKSEGENGTAHESIVNTLKDQGFNEQPKPEGEPRTMKNAFSDKYQKIDNSNLNEYQKVDNISNNKNTENGVTNMNTNQESQATAEAKSLEDQYREDPLRGHAFKDGSMHISPSAHKGEQSAVVKFYNKPEQSTIDMLKQNGFKWAQYKKSWVHNGEIGNKLHLDVLKALKGVAPAPQASQATAQPTQQPTQQPSKAKTETKITKPANTNMSVKAYEGKANINPRVATYLEDMGMKLSKAQYDKIATDYPAGDRSGNASALAGRDMRALQAFKKDYAKEISNTIADQEAAFEDVGGYHDFKGGSITISKKSEIGNMLHERQHASISFAGKPSEETRSLLKKNGFTYNPRYKTWENTGKLGNASHEKILQTLRDGVTIENTQQATPTPTAQPTPQAEGKQYHGTGIENKNGRFEISFNEFPSFKLRSDMKNNGFKWDPTAKVWHTTDREKLDQVLSKHFSERT